MKTKLIARPCALGTLVAFLIGASASAGPTIGASFESTVASNYVFRGAPQYANKSDPSIQGSAGITIDQLGPGSLGLSLWNATALSNYQEHGGSELELDLTATYGLDIGGASLGFGYVAYLYPNSEVVDGAHEFFSSLSYEFATLTPSLVVYVDPIRLKGAYFAAGVSKSISYGQVSLTPSLTMGIAGYEGTEVQLNDVTGSFVGNYQLPADMYAVASVNYAYYAASNLRSMSDRSTVWASLGFGVSL